jgi:hypothetical protein
MSEEASFCSDAPEAWHQYLVTVPAAVLRTGEHSSFSCSHSRATLTARDGLHRRASRRLWKERFRKQGEDAPGLVKLLCRILIIDSKRRASASDLLQDPYLAL